MNFSGLFKAALAASLVINPAILQASQEADDDAIVVTGRTMTRSQAHELARNYARAVLAPSVAGQNARWSAPICLGVVGLREDYALVLIDRIEASARAAGARVASRSCSPNVLLTFAKDSDAVFAELSRDRPDVLSDTGLEELRKLQAKGLPIRWFYSQTVEGLGGRPTVPGEGELPTLKNISGGRISSPVQVSITGCTVLIDTPRVSHVPVDALTDYIAFAILSRTRIDAIPSAASIMSLFEAPETDRPAGMTVMDKAMLKALYRIPINRNASVHRNLIASEIIKEVATVP